MVTGRLPGHSAKVAATAWLVVLVAGSAQAASDPRGAPGPAPSAATAAESPGLPGIGSGRPAAIGTDRSRKTPGPEDLGSGAQAQTPHPGRRLAGLLRGIVYIGIASTALIIVVLLGERLWRSIEAAIERRIAPRIRPVRVQSLELLKAERIAGFLRGAANAVWILVMLLLVCVYLSVLLAFFPATRGMAGAPVDYLLGAVEDLADTLVAYLPNLFVLLVLTLLTYGAIRVARILFGEIDRGTVKFRGFYREWAWPTFSIIRFLIIALALVVAFPYLPGSSSPAFRGVSIFLGVLFSLGSSSAVANVVAGLILTYMRAFQVGDRVRIASTVGDVVERTLLVTRVQTIKNVAVTIPNAMILAGHTENYTAAAGQGRLILNTTVTIGYDAPWRTVHELLARAARSTEGVLETPVPFVLQTRLDDFYVRYELNAYTARADLVAVTYSLLHQNIQDRFNEAGVEIMSPHYAQLRDGNATTIPDPGRSTLPAARAFRVATTAHLDGGPTMPHGDT